MIPLFGSVSASTYLIRFVSKKSKEKSKSSGNDSEHDKESNETNYDDEDQHMETNLVAFVAVKANSVKCHLIVIVYHMISNAEKEKLVIDLYYNQLKNVRQIAQEARMSFRDIAAVLKKKEAAAVNDGSGSGNGIVAMDNQQQQIGNGSSRSNQKSIQAYKLFSEGKTPVKVAIQSSLSEKEATIYYTEYGKLKRLYSLYHIYQESKGNLSYILKLCRLAKRQAITADNIEWFVNMVNLYLITLIR